MPTADRGRGHAPQKPESAGRIAIDFGGSGMVVFTDNTTDNTPGSPRFGDVLTSWQSVFPIHLIASTEYFSDPTTSVLKLSRENGTELLTVNDPTNEEIQLVAALAHINQNKRNLLAGSLPINQRGTLAGG